MQEFLEIVEQLAIWKFFPSGTERGTLAVKLSEWCEGKIERAEWLAKRVDEFDEYPGPATLRAMIKDKFQPAGMLANYTADRMPEVLPPIECGTCNDTGTVMIADRHAWCSCRVAAQMRVEMPRWLEISNRHRPTREGRLREEMRAAEVAKKLENLERGYGTDEKRA